MPIPISAHERRRAIQEQAAKLRIDEAYVSVLVDTFYERVRGHAELGPIFQSVIEDNWDHHLGKMKQFWASVAFNAGNYQGQPGPKHKALTQTTDVEARHFEIWLQLFEETLQDTAPSPGAVPYFMERAHRIAQSLQLMMFGAPELRDRTVAP